MSIKRFLAIALVLCMAFGMTACGSSESEKSSGDVQGSESQGKDSIVLAANREPASLDPAAVTVSYATLIESNIYDCLLQFDADCNVVSDLAESWKQLDDLTWQFNLKKGIKFHNGEEMTSKDVLFSYKRLYDQPTGSKYVSSIDPEGFQTPDDYTFILKTNEPFVYLESYVCENTLSILSEKAVTEMGDEKYARNPVGTGPYKFVSWASGDNITLESWDGYYGKPAKIKNVICKFITENSARTINLESGEVDFVFDLQESDADRITNGADTKTYIGAGATNRYFAFNCQHDVFKDVRVRKAMIMATDLESIRQLAYPTAEPSAWTVVPPGLEGRRTDLKPVAYDPEGAKALLKEAGVGDGFSVYYIYLASTVNNMVAEAIQAMWKEVGVTLELTPLESATLSTAMNNQEQDFCLAGTSVASFQAGQGLFDFFHTDSIGSTSNRSYLANPDVDSIIDQIMAEFDKDKRSELVGEAQEMIHDLYPIMIIGHTSYIVGMRKNVQGFEFTPTQRYDLSKLYFE
ncbi:MAG: ABC transporter substrate-binding protein [Clostridiaceae bacterium]|nr:ABC transporter substrate-binding protein [Clostridiaceae bacterium]